MKKFIFASLSFLALGMMLVSCSGSDNSKKNDEKDASGVTAVEKTSDSPETQNISGEHASYRVVEGKIQSESGKPLVVDFYADWCPPCRQMKPVFASLAEKYQGKLDFVSINVDEEENLAAAYGVESIPCFIFITPEGEVLGKIVGSTPEKEFAKAIASYFPSI